MARACPLNGQASTGQVDQQRRIHPPLADRGHGSGACTGTAGLGFAGAAFPYTQLRVWERGAGETQACGTGACAAAVAAITQGWMDSPLLIDLPGGRLSIEWAGPGHPVMMTGPATRVYEGQVRL